MVSLRGWRPAVTITLLILVLPLLGCAWIALRSYQREASFYVPRQYEVPLDEASSLPDPETVTLDGSTGEIEGWYSASTNGATIVLLHGSGGDRRGVLPEATMLAAEGYGVLLFDMPGYGASEGDVDWSDGGRAALIGALDFLAARPEVDPERLGAIGSSMGGFIVAQVAATDDRLRAVVLVGAPHDQDEVTRHENSRYGPLSELPAIWAMERGGLPRDELPPIELIDQIAPRAVLVVAGAQDALVTPDFTRALFDAAEQPKDLVFIDGAGHGGHLSDGGESFREPVLRFFQEQLTPLK